MIIKSIFQYIYAIYDMSSPIPVSNSVNTERGRKLWESYTDCSLWKLRFIIEMSLVIKIYLWSVSEHSILAYKKLIYQCIIIIRLAMFQRYQLVDAHSTKCYVAVKQQSNALLLQYRKKVNFHEWNWPN